jgi:hypothetical protein
MLNACISLRLEVLNNKLLLLLLLNHKNSGWTIFICVCTESEVSSRQNDTLFAGFDEKLNVLQGDEKNKSNSV